MAPEQDTGENLNVEAESRGESVVERIVRILEVFDARSPTLTISEVARRADLPVPTAHRMVMELLRLAVLQRNDDGRVRIGLRLWELASRSSQAVELRAAALPFLEDLQSVVRHHTLLGVVDGHEVLYLETLSSPGATVILTRTAGRMPLYAGASGLVLLAHSSPELQEEILGGDLHARTPQTITDPAALRKTLADIRHKGFMTAERFVHEDVSSAAVPVKGRDGTVIAAISVIAPSGGDQAARALPALQAAARGVTRSLIASQGQHPWLPPIRRATPVSSSGLTD